MQDLKLNNGTNELVPAREFILDPTQEYIINIWNERGSQLAIRTVIQMRGLPALRDYYNWLEVNGFDAKTPNPTNDFLSQYFGKKPLWKTKLSQGIVVQVVHNDDYYIIMECSRLNKGFKNAQIIMPLDECL